LGKYKTYYTLENLTGVISLLIIPVLFYVFYINQKVQNEDNYIYFNLPPKDYFKKYPEGDYKVGYNYRQINLPVKFSKEMEEYYLNLIIDIQKENIDKTGIKFQFTDENTYQDFIRLLDLMEISDQFRYGLDIEDDNFYVINDKEPE
jgi:hypothetical protein